ncbi:MAG: ribosome-associated translation inhibitor RaiA [Alphaproteobacteria bacterium]|nr:ribosome-associated translation inhibitor RaiA [Alphaproteobacteria bacterium]
MDINVTGRKMNVGAALTQHAEERLATISEKFFSRSIDANATFVKEGHLYRIDVSLHANQGINMQARAEADDPYAAFEMAADKIEKQLRRYKRRLKNHHHMPQREIAVEVASDLVFAPEKEDAEGMLNGESAEAPPLIIAESKKEIPQVSVGDAVMLMDLADASVFMFRNSKSDTLDVVYRRPDGNIGWISPSS